MDTCKSFINPKTCGFRRTAAFLVASSKELCEENKTKQDKFEEYCSLFEEEYDFPSFITSANRLKAILQKWEKKSN